MENELLLVSLHSLGDSLFCWRGGLDTMVRSLGGIE